MKEVQSCEIFLRAVSELTKKFQSLLLFGFDALINEVSERCHAETVAEASEVF